MEFASIVLCRAIQNNFTENELKNLVSQNLFKRIADPAEIARPIVFLASEAASFVTGTNLEISGGQNINLSYN